MCRWTCVIEQSLVWIGWLRMVLRATKHFFGQWLLMRESTGTKPSNEPATHSYDKCFCRNCCSEQVESTSRAKSVRHAVLNAKAACATSQRWRNLFIGIVWNVWLWKTKSLRSNIKLHRLWRSTQLPLFSINGKLLARSDVAQICVELTWTNMLKAVAFESQVFSSLQPKRFCYFAKTWGNSSTVMVIVFICLEESRHKTNRVLNMAVYGSVFDPIACNAWGTPVIKKTIV